MWSYSPRLDGRVPSWRSIRVICCRYAAGGRTLEADGHGRMMLNGRRLSAMRDDDRPAGKRAVEKPVRRARAAGGNGDARPARPVRRRAVVGTSRLRSEYGLTRQAVARMV